MAQLDHINMTVKNIKESINWYDRVFNYKLVEKGSSNDGTPFAVIKNGNSMLCIYENQHLKEPSLSEGVHRTYHFGLRIDNREKWEDTIKNEKVEISHTWQYPHSYSWYLLDPSGHEIEVVLWNNDKVKFN